MSDDLIRTIKERVDVVELIQREGVRLRKQGRTFVGFCPFHPNTRTPAFTVYPDSRSYFCFGCHATGTVFDFVMQRRGCDFTAALALLAEQAGITIPARSDEARAQARLRARLLELHTLAARYFTSLLLHRRGEAALAYLTRDRRITLDSIEQFQLGYAPPSAAGLLSHLTRTHGYSIDEVMAAGLAVQRRNGYADRFIDRIMFPIRTADGQVVGFGGRQWPGMANPHGGKYINTPRTVIFDKGHLLYGLDLARAAIQAARRVTVVEGYFDVIAGHQYGDQTLVAPLGTALTVDHVRQLKWLAPTVILALDADAAGQQATVRAIQRLREEVDAAALSEGGITIRVARMPPGADPDQVFHTSPEAWAPLIEGAVPVIEFLLDAATRDVDLSTSEGQRAALASLVPVLAALDPIAQGVMIGKLEQRTGMRAGLIRDLVRDERQRQRAEAFAVPANPAHAPAVPPPPVPPTRHAIPLRELTLVAAIWRQPALRQVVDQWLAAERTRAPAIAMILGDRLEQVVSDPVLRLLSTTAPAPLEDPLVASYVSLLTAVPPPPEDRDRARRDVEERMRLLRVEQVQQAQDRLIIRLDATGEDEADLTRHLEAQLQMLYAYGRSLTEPPDDGCYPDLRDRLAAFD